VVDTLAGVTRTTIGAVPVPLRLTTVVPPLEELLVMVSCPLATPTAVGSNSTLGVTAWPGFNVTGNLTPDMVKPAPFSVAALIVTGAVPVAFNARDCAAGVFSSTSPKATLVASVLNVIVAAFNSKAKPLETPPALAVSVAACAVSTDATVAEKEARFALAGTDTLAGNVTFALLLDRLTSSPLPGAAALSVTAQESVPDPVMDALLQETALTATGLASM
jgi:hypothetical protein